MYRRLISALSVQSRSQFSLRLLARFFSFSNDPKLSFLYEQLEKTIAQPISNREQLARAKSESRVTRTVKQDEEEDRIDGRELVISHPWPEWVGLMELLLKKDYLDLVGLDDVNRVRTACLQFARDRPGIIR
jgi:hypothetical protein